MDSTTASSPGAKTPPAALIRRVLGRPAAGRAEPVVPPPAVVEIEQLDFAYGTVPALHDINLRLEPHCVTAFIGPSGCGKTTLLRCLNRLNDLIDGARVTRGTADRWRRISSSVARQPTGAARRTSRSCWIHFRWSRNRR